jgi:selenide,water dikinase
MNKPKAPIVKDLVLLGGGHSHVTVIKRFGMKPIPGVRLTLICRDVHTPYSGMLPGFIAGHYTYDDAHIDLVPLARFAGARFIHDEVVGIDTGGRRLKFRRRPDVPYDAVSIDTGSTPGLTVPGAEGRVVPVKPINNFISRWNRLVERVLALDRAPRIAVVGTGAGGVEICLAVQYRLRKLREANASIPGDAEYHLFGADPTVLATHNRFVQGKFDRVLQDRGIRVHTSSRVAEVTGEGLRLESGEEFGFDEILWVTTASAPAWPREGGLDVDQRGFIQVSDTLQSLSYPEVFAAGDVAAVVNHPREKAGVFAVRQGPPLEANLRRFLLGEPPQPFRPQSKFLSLISTGDKYAVASRSSWALEGPRLWSLKDWIDRRFMDKYNRLPEMKTEAGEEPSIAGNGKIAAPTMRCAGCGSKVGATALEKALSRLAPTDRPDVIAGLGRPDDAAVVRIPEGKVAVQSVDFFRAIVEDPYVFGQIAANHALGDIFAMGAEPQTALAIATLPLASEEKTEELLVQLLLGAQEALSDAGAALVGGHTSEGEDLALGFAVNGWADPDKILRKQGLRPGDRLLLTKPLGTGTLFAAEMRRKAKGRWRRRGAPSIRSHGL